MNEKQTKQKSKFLSLVLRHQPQTIGIELDESGWVKVESLLVALKRHGKGMTRQSLEFVVSNNDKQRFAFSDDGTRIRANQGHSIDVNLKHKSAEPPKSQATGRVRSARHRSASGGCPSCDPVFPAFDMPCPSVSN